MGCKLTISDPNSIFSRFKCLKIVDFSNCELEQIPDSLIENEQLIMLTIENNPIKSLKNNLDQLKSLKNLEIDKLSLNESSLFNTNKVKKADLFKLPKGIEKLALKSMQFSFIPFDLSECATSLVHFDFEGVRWPNLNEYGGMNASITHEQVCRFFQHQLTKKELEKLLSYFDSAGESVKGIIQQRMILKLNAFVFKHFPRLSPSQANPSTRANPSGVPEIIFDFSNLTHLNLSYQVII